MTKEQQEQAAATAATVLGFGLFGVACVGAVGVVVSLLPGFIAFTRGHQNAFPILLVALFFGWTVVGWFVALIWAFTAVDRGRYRD